MNLISYIRNGLVRSGAQDFVIELNRDKSVQIKFVNNEIVVNTTWLSRDINIFAAINKRIISSRLKDLTKSSAEETIRNVVKLSKMIKPNKNYMGIAQGPFKYKKLEGLFDKNIDGVAADELVEIAIKGALESGAERVCGVLGKSIGENLLVTSGGVEASEKGTHLYLSLRGLIKKDASGHSVCASRSLKEFNIEKTAEESAEIARKAVNPKQGKTGVYDIIFYPLPFANFLTTIGFSASIFNIEAGLSFFKDKIKKRVASNKFTLLDDATIPKSVGATCFDSEGVPTQKNIIIEEGILKTYLHNTSTALRYKTKTTANAGLIVPEPINLYLKEGDLNYGEMIEEVKNGLIITNTWYTRFQNYATGDFSTIPRDGIFLIKNGKIEGAVKGIRISDNMINIMKNVVGLSRKASQILGWEIEVPATLPHVLVKDVRVTTSLE